MNVELSAYYDSIASFACTCKLTLKQERSLDKKDFSRFTLFYVILLFSYFQKKRNEKTLVNLKMLSWYRFYQGCELIF